MRILLTADPGFPVPPVLYGGIERIIAGLADELQKRGHVVALIADQGSTCSVNQLFPWPQRSPRIANAHRFAGTLSAAARAFKPDILHSFSRLLYMALVLRSRLPKLMSFQREPTPRTVRWANRLARGSLTFTGCSEAISAKGRRAGGRWETIHNFVDLDRFTFLPTISSEAPLIFLSRIEQIKGAHTAIEVCRRAGRRLIIAGNHAEDDSDDGRYWREEILPHIGKDGVEYVGAVDDKQKNYLLGKAAALIVPVQWEEPFGIVFAEALACGTPVISCPRGALPEIVQSGRHGFLAAEVDAMIDAVRNLPQIDRRDCRTRAEENFSSGVIVDRYTKLYAEWLSSM